MKCVEQFLIENQNNLLHLCNRKVRNGEDLFQDLCVWVLSDLKASELCDKKELLYYCIRMINICGFSRNTPYYYKYERFQDLTLQIQPWTQRKTEEPIDCEKEMQWIEQELKNLPWFEARIFEVYYWHKHTLQTLADETGIAKSTINKAVNKAKTHLKKEAARLGGRSGVRSQGDKNRQDSDSSGG